MSIFSPQLLCTWIQISSVNRHFYSFVQMTLKRLLHASDLNKCPCEVLFYRSDVLWQHWRRSVTQIHLVLSFSLSLHPHSAFFPPPACVGHRNKEWEIRWEQRGRPTLSVTCFLSSEQNHSLIKHMERRGGEANLVLNLKTRTTLSCFL